MSRTHHIELKLSESDFFSQAKRFSRLSFMSYYDMHSTVFLLIKEIK